MLEEDFFQVGLFSIRVGLFLARGGLFSIGVGLFLVGGGLFLSPTVAEKSPTPAEKSPTAILKRCWTLEYFGELEFSSPFMEQWTLDARGVLNTYCFVNPSSISRILNILLHLSTKTF